MYIIGFQHLIYNNQVTAFYLQLSDSNFEVINPPGPNIIVKRRKDSPHIKVRFSLLDQSNIVGRTLNI